MFLQSNMRINAEPIFAIAKVSNKVLAQIIELKKELATNCKPIDISFNSKTQLLSISGINFQLTKIKKNDSALF